jgi:hypothetical protein
MLKGVRRCRGCCTGGREDPGRRADCQRRSASNCGPPHIALRQIATDTSICTTYLNAIRNTGLRRHNPSPESGLLTDFHILLQQLHAACMWPHNIPLCPGSDPPAEQNHPFSPLRPGGAHVERFLEYIGVRTKVRVRPSSARDKEAFSSPL